MEQQQVARSIGPDYRDEDELDSVPPPSSSAAVTTEFFPVNAGRVDGSSPGSVVASDGAVDRLTSTAASAAAATVAAERAMAGSSASEAGIVAPAGVDGAGAGQVSAAAALDAQPKARRQSEGAPAPIIPDCCNVGVALRTTIVANAAALLLVAVQAGDGPGFLQVLATTAMLLEPALFTSLIGLCVLRRWANGQSLRVQWGVGIFLPVAITGTIATVLAPYVFPDQPLGHFDWVLTRMLLAAGTALVLLEYFRLRARAYAPSFSEARLQALQARIRPHFLFNSLNTVLGLIRTDPRRAEQTLENLADLFRVFMRDARELVPLDDEVLTCKEYLAIEQLRLTNRLKIVWDIDEMPGDALIPSLLLQPLLENAVHHGIEPRTSQGTLNIKITRPGERVKVDIDNPLSSTPPTRSGNQMALSNVRERLMLLYDMEAELKTFTRDERFYLQLEFPYRKERRRRDVRRHHIHPDR